MRKVPYLAATAGCCYQMHQMYKQDDIQERVVQAFLEKGHTRRQVISEETVYQVLNQRCLLAVERPFDIDLFEELMQQCKKSVVICPSNFGLVVGEAFCNLERNITDARRKDGIMDDRKQALKQKKHQLDSIKEDHSLREDLQKELQSEIAQLQLEIAHLSQDLQLFERELNMLDIVFVNFNPKDTTLAPQQKQVNPKSLTYIFYLSWICLFFEIFITSIRPSFMTLLFYLHVNYFLFVGYLNRKAGSFLLIQNLVTILLDICYFLTEYALHWTNSKQHCPGVESWLLIIFEACLLLSILIRCALIYLIFPFRVPPTSRLIVFRVLKHDFQLHRRIKIRKFKYEWDKQ